MKTLQLEQVLQKFIPEAQFDHTVRALMQDELLWKYLNQEQFLEAFDAQWTPSAESLSPADLALFAIEPRIASVGYPDASLPASLLEEALLGYENYRAQSIPLQSMRESGLMAIALYEKFRQGNDWSRIIFEITDGIDHRQENYLLDFWKSPFAIVADLVDDPRPFFLAIFESKARKTAHSLFRHLVLTQAVSREDQANLVISTLFSQPVETQAAVLKSFHQNSDSELLHLAAKGLFSRHLVRDLDEKSTRELWQDAGKYLEDGCKYRDLAVIAQFAGEYETAEKLLSSYKNVLKAELAGSAIQGASLKLEQKQPIDGELGQIPDDVLQAPEIAAEIACLGPETVTLKGIEKSVPAFEMNEAVKMYRAGNGALAREAAAKSVQPWLAPEAQNRINALPMRALNWMPGNVIDPLIEMEMWTEAASLVREVLAQFPVNLKTLEQAALIAKKLGDRPEQLAHLEKMNLLEPGNEDYRRELAEAYLAGENWQAAYKTYQRLTTGQNSVKTVDLLGMAKSALKCSEYAVAQEYAGKVLASEPENGQALAISGYAWNKQGNPDKGIELLKRAVKLSSDDSEPWLLQADLYAENGDTAKSVNTLRSALTAHPESSVIRVKLARTLIDNGQASEALAVIDDVAEASNDKEMALLKLHAMKLLNLPELANTAEQLYQVYPNDSEIRREYAMAQLEKGNRDVVRKLVDPATASDDEELALAYCDAVLGEDYRKLHFGKTHRDSVQAKAAELLQNVLLKNPSSVTGRMLLAETLIHEGKTEKAFEFLTNLLGDPDAQSSTLLDRIQAGFAWAASLLDKADMALGAAQNVAESNPSWAGAGQTLAEINANLGDVADAVSEATNVLETVSEMSGSVDWFSKFMDELGQREEAEKILKELADTRKNKTPYLLKLAEYQLERGENAEAAALIEGLKSAPAKIKSEGETIKAAKLFGRLNDKTAAEECLRARLNSDESDQQNAYVDLAGFQYSNGMYNKALETIKLAKGRFGAQRWIELLEAETLHSNGNAQAALEMLQELDAANDRLPELDELAFLPAQWVPLLQPQASTDNLIRSLAFESGNYDAAIPAADMIAGPADLSLEIEVSYAIGNPGVQQNWMNVNPEEESIYQSACLAAQIAELLLDAGLVERAALVIKRGLELFPQERGLLVNASRYSGMIGDLNTAEALFDQVLPQFSRTDKFNSVISVCALRNLLKAAAVLNRWKDALSWQSVLLQANQHNIEAEKIALQTLVRALEFALFTENMEITIHIDAAPVTIDGLRKDLRTLVANLDTQSNRSFDHWTARAKAVLEPNQSNIRALALKTPEGDDVAAMMLALNRSGQSNTAQQLTAKFEGDPRVAYASAWCLKDSNPEKALEVLKKSTRTTTAQPWANVLAQSLYKKTGENYSAINEIEEAVQSWPQEPEWHVMAADCWQRTGDTQNAVNHLEQAQKLLPQDNRVSYLLGKAYLQGNETEKAIQTLESASKTAANHYETWETLAEAYYAAGNKEKALQAAEKAGGINGFSMKPMLLSAKINLDNGDVRKALEQAQTANRHDEQDAESLVLLAKAWIANGNKLQAMQTLEKVSHSKNPSTAVLIEQAKMIQQINGPASSRMMLEALEQKYPENTEVLNLLAEAQLAAGDKSAAENSALRSLKVQEMQPQMQRFIGKLDLESGHLDQAIHHFSQAIALEPQDSEVYMELSDAYVQQRDYESALKTLDRVIELSPEDIRPLMTQATLLRNSKDYSQAESRLRKAAEIAPNDLNVKRQLGAVIALNMVHSSQEASSHI
jgi:predicted Zn-dependent protease